MHAGPGYGGSCFPKDVKAFINTAKKNNVDFSILSAVDNFNDERISEITKKIISKSNLSKGNTATMLGLSFKPNTDDIRDSTSIKIAKILNEKGINIKCYDPQAMTNAKKENSFLVLSDDAYAACEESKVIIIGTEWNEFRALDLKQIIGKQNNLCIFDLRNIHNPNELKEIGFNYFGTGT